MAIDVNQIIAPEMQPAPEEQGSINPASALETLPADVLDIPAVFAVAKGQPAAVSAPNPSDDAAIKALTKNAQALVGAGFGLYESRDGKTRVLYNSSLMDVGSLLDADVQGTLGDVAPSFSTLQTPGANPALPGATGAAPAAESQPAPDVQNQLSTKRTTNLTPGGPTSGARPGAGRILNNILKSAV